MEDMGASLIDIGAMSTAPYLQTLIPLHQEVRRMVDAVKAVKISCNLPVLADTPRGLLQKKQSKRVLMPLMTFPDSNMIQTWLRS